MKKMVKWIAVSLVVSAMFFQVSPSQAKTAYMIGNSFTHNAEPYSIPALAQQQSNTLTVGAHINSGSPLHNIWGRPDDAREVNPTFGKYANALPNFEWDVVTLQCFYKNAYEGFPPSTMQTDIDAALSFIDLTRQNPANSDTKFYIYASWPFEWVNGTYEEKWEASSIDDLSTRTTHKRDYFNDLIKRLRAETDAEVNLISVPEVMYALDQKMQNGEVPGFTSIDDLTDGLHLNAGLGEYMAGVTVYTTIFGENPAGLVRPDGHYDDGDNSLFTPETLAIFHETTWDVVSTHPYSGVVPEPTSMCLLALGSLMGTLMLRRRIHPR